MLQTGIGCRGSGISSRGSGASVAVRSRGSFGSGEDSIYKGTMHAGPAAVSSRQKPCRIACYCICSNSTAPATPGSGGPGDVCKWLSAPGGVVISVRAGAGRTVSGRPASELTFGGVSVEDDCCGGIEDVDADADVCTGLLARVARS